MANIPAGGDFDELVPDPQVWSELNITSMTGWRWTRDPELSSHHLSKSATAITAPAVCSKNSKRSCFASPSSSAQATTKRRHECGRQNARAPPPLKR